MANDMPFTINITASHGNEQALSNRRFFDGGELEGLNPEKRNVSRGWIKPPTA
jgi:hypothetical protein